MTALLSLVVLVTALSVQFYFEKVWIVGRFRVYIREKNYRDKFCLFCNLYDYTDIRMLDPDDYDDDERWYKENFVFDVWFGYHFGICEPRKHIVR